MKTSINRVIKKTVSMLAVAAVLFGSLNLVAFAAGPVASVSLDKETLTITKGASATLIATVLPADAPDTSVTWNSSNTSVATVDGTGAVTAVDVGTADITVTTTDGGLTAKCTVTVTPALTSITSLSSATLELYVGETSPLTAVLVPAEATNVAWSSDTPAVATVSGGVGNTTITAIAPGDATITISSTPDGAVKAVCTVKVKRHVASVALDKASLELCEGDTAQLSALVSPADATDKTLVWTSSDNEIATVSAGLVTVIQVGKVDITATSQDGSLKAACTVNIKPNKLSSTKYMAQNGLLKGVAKFTVMPIFKANLNNEKADIHIYKPDGTEVTGGIIGTGAVVKLFVGGKERDSLTVVVSGDADGDGGITVSDYTLARLSILGLKPLSGSLSLGADVDGDGAITIKDYTLMRLDILNMKLISTAPPDLPEVTDPRIRKFLDIALSLQGKPYVWGARGPDSFDCSGFIYYCLNQAGYAVGRSTAHTYSGNSDWQPVDRNALQPGDLMFYWSDSKPGVIGHVGIYLGNGYHIHASSDYGFIVICRVEGWYDRQLSHGRRVFF